MTLEDVLRDIHAMREDLLLFERKYGVPSELFYDAYCRGEEPAEASWVLDWGEWAATYRIHEERLATFAAEGRHLLQSAQIASYAELIARTARHESIPVSR